MRVQRITNTRSCLPPNSPGTAHSTHHRPQPGPRHPYPTPFFLSLAPITLALCKKIHGHYTGWYENGQKRYETNYVDGKEHGLYTEWRENGQKETEGNAKEGKPHGLWTEWDEEGKVTSQTMFENGEKVE